MHTAELGSTGIRVSRLCFGTGTHGWAGRSDQERMDAAGIGVYGMKVVGCGDLGNDARDAIHFVLDLPSVDAITIGMASRDEVDENIGWVESHLPVRRTQTGDRSFQPV
jgi:aryl-alcohol dehydrogenase-like predicted oxidoreductase